VDGISSSKVHVIGRDVAEGLVVAPGLVIVDKDGDFPLQFLRCLPDNEADAFLARSMVAFDLPVGLGDDRARSVHPIVLSELPSIPLTLPSTVFSHMV
jgi:hypothetical protein